MLQLLQKTTSMCQITNNRKGCSVLYLAVVDDLLDLSILPLGKLVLGKVLRKEISHSLDWHHRVLTDQVPAFQTLSEHIVDEAPILQLVQAFLQAIQANMK